MTDYDETLKEKSSQLKTKIDLEKDDSLDIFLKDDDQINNEFKLKRNDDTDFHESTLTQNEKLLNDNSKIFEGRKPSYDFNDGTVISNAEYEAEKREPRPFLERYFGKIKEGSLRGSVFSMITIALGSGILSVPYSFKVMSITLAIFFLCWAAGNFIMNLYFLAIIANKAKKYEYSVLMKELVHPNVSKIYDICAVIYLFGVFIAYQVIMYRIVMSVDYDLFYKGNETLIDFLDHGYMTGVAYKWSVSFGITIIILYPLSIMKSLSEFRAISLLAIFSIIYILLVRFFGIFLFY